MAFWSFQLAEPGHECEDLSKASDWFQVTNTLPSMLVELHMSGCELNQIPVGVANMTRLKVLNLRNYFNGSVSEILGSLSRYSSGQMESLKLSTNDFSGPLSDQLGNFKHLRLLALSSNSISDPIPVSLGNLSFLE
ncbi:hypothetical protein ACE6H2_014601 [Prunus campanulata]